MTRDEIQHRILRLLQDNPELSQRDLADALGVSVGSTHYCLRALIDRGWVKAANFASSTNKSRYLYRLTPSGLTQKALMARTFLQRKRAEFAAIREEIASLEAELAAGDDAGDDKGDAEASPPIDETAARGQRAR